MYIYIYIYKYMYVYLFIKYVYVYIYIRGNPSPPYVLNRDSRIPLVAQLYEYEQRIPPGLPCK